MYDAYRLVRAGTGRAGWSPIMSRPVLLSHGSLAPFLFCVRYHAQECGEAS